MNVSQTDKLRKFDYIPQSHRLLPCNEKKIRQFFEENLDGKLRGPISHEEEKILKDLDFQLDLDIDNAEVTEDVKIFGSNLNSLMAVIRILLSRICQGKRNQTAIEIQKEENTVKNNISKSKQIYNNKAMTLFVESMASLSLAGVLLIPDLSDKKDLITSIGRALNQFSAVFQNVAEGNIKKFDAETYLLNQTLQKAREQMSQQELRAIEDGFNRLMAEVSRVGVN